MCQHQPRCPQSPAPDHLAARIVAAHPEQGWNMLLVDAERGQLAHRVVAGRSSGPPELRPLQTHPENQSKAKDQNS